MIDLVPDIKHIVKLALGRSDDFWYLKRFENSIDRRTIENREMIIKEAEIALSRKNEIEENKIYDDSEDPIIRQGWKLKREVENKFRYSRQHLKNARILLHLPDEKSSPAGFSIFENLLESFSFLGIETELLRFGQSTKDRLNDFKPTVFLTGDNQMFLEKIDWDAMAEYRTSNKLLIGLTASIEAYGNTLLNGRLAWAKEHGIDFYYTFRDIGYVNERKEYQPFFDAGYSIFSIPFGANPLVHYPIPGIKRDLDYAFIASTNKTKSERYYKYMRAITSKYRGLIDGPGWRHVQDFHFNRNRDRYIYARAKTGLNIHLEEQMRWANETNERTYQLAACGVPIVTDHARLLDKLFEPDSLFIADTPRQYRRHFEFILKNPEAARERALKAQKQVFEKHTTFHRASDFVTMISKRFGLGTQ